MGVRPLCMREITPMSIRSALLLAGSAVLAASVPAAAQDDRYHGVADPLPPLEVHQGEYDGEWQGEWTQDESWRGEWDGTYTDDEGRTTGVDYRGEWTGYGDYDTWGYRDGRHDRDSHHRRHRGRHHRDEGPRLAYSAAERDQWLMDCQYLMADGGGYYEDERDEDGRLIGGLLGAVLGGVAGNRIADGDRLLGTVVGAGLGGLAGAAIGSVLDGDGDGELSRNEIWAARYCDAYLRRHELGGGEFAQAQQVVMVPVAASSRRGHRRGDDCRTCREVVTEEWVEVEQAVSRPTPRPRPQPRPAPRPRGKLTPTD
ncbi:MAG: glycine zipper 2TM domain-containing protein [Erythrobacter sp.]|nr:MAG: glycine zipper 2TM domain-containing protein [Erythrobacter sp.]